MPQVAQTPEMPPLPPEVLFSNVCVPHRQDSLDTGPVGEPPG